MEIQQLRCFIAVSDHGTFTRAAETLHVTQPTLSHAIGKLESAIKLKLFHRTPRGATLTSAGLTLLPLARQALSSMDSVDSAVSAIHGVTTGVLRIVALRTFTSVAAGVLAAFHEEHPHVTLHIGAPETDDGVFDSIASGAFDIGFARLPRVPAFLRKHHLTDQQMVAYLPPGTAAQVESGSMTLRQFASLPQIVPPLGSGARSELERLFAEAGLPIDVAAENAHYESVLDMVVGGVGAALTTVSETHLGHLDRRLIRVIEPSRRAPVGLVWLDGELSPAASAFRDVAVNYFAGGQLSAQPTDASGLNGTA